MNRFRPDVVIRDLGPHGEDHLCVLNADGFETRLVKPCDHCCVTTARAGTLLTVDTHLNASPASRP